MKLFALVILAALSLSLSASSIRPTQPRLCAGIRGNGQYIFTHWGSLARILELYGESMGPIEGIAGGSSASITSFVYESMYKNPAVWDCRGARCSDKVAAQKLALLLKSLQGYTNIIKATKEVDAIKGLFILKKQWEDGNIDKLLENPTLTEMAKRKVMTLLESTLLKPLVNPQLKFAIEKNPAFYLKEIKAAFDGLTFNPDDPAILYRLGLISFEALALKFGYIADFYANDGLATEFSLKYFLNRCAYASKGLTWEEFIKEPRGKKCEALFNVQLNDYRERLTEHLLKNGMNYPSARLRENVGKYLPVLTSTSVFSAAAAQGSFQKGLFDYLKGNPIELDFNFEWIKFGYWGEKRELAAAKKYVKSHFFDPKSDFVSIGSGPWSEVLQLSPAEPGLSPVMCRRSGKWDSFHLVNAPECELVSAGGWSDLAPIPVLRGLGCEKTIYITRQGEESEFAIGVAKLFGMNAEQQRALYDLDNPESSFSISLKESDAVYCTDWGNPEKVSGKSVEQMYHHTFHDSWLFSNDPGFLDVDYSHTAKYSDGFRGCASGI